MTISERLRTQGFGHRKPTGPEGRVYNKQEVFDIKTGRPLARWTVWSAIKFLEQIEA